MNGLTGVTPLRGQSIASDEEREFVRELATKVRNFVESNGKLPDVGTLCLYGPDRNGENTWTMGYIAPNEMGKIMAYGITMACITKSLSV